MIVYPVRTRNCSRIPDQIVGLKEWITISLVTAPLAQLKLILDALTKLNTEVASLQRGVASLTNQVEKLELSFPFQGHPPDDL